MAPGLLGAHVSRRPHQVAVGGQGQVRPLPQRQPEVHHQGPAHLQALAAVGPLTGDHDVAGLEVAMDDAPAVGVIDGLGDVRQQRRRLAEGQPAGFQDLREGQAGDKVGDEDRHAFQGRHLVDHHDARVAQLGRGLGLALEALHRLDLGQQAGMGNLQGHDAVQFRVARLPDGPAGAGPDALQELEFAQGRRLGPRVGIGRGPRTRKVLPHPGHSTTSSGPSATGSGVRQFGQRRRPAAGPPAAEMREGPLAVCRGLPRGSIGPRRR